MRMKKTKLLGIFAVFTIAYIAKEVNAMKIKEKVTNKLNEKKWYYVELETDAIYSVAIVTLLGTLKPENRRLWDGNPSKVLFKLNLDSKQKAAFEVAARDYLIKMETEEEVFNQDKSKARLLVYK